MCESVVMNVRMKTTNAYIATVSAVRERRANGYAKPSLVASARPPKIPIAAATRSCCSAAKTTALPVRTIPWTT